MSETTCLLHHEIVADIKRVVQSLSLKLNWKTVECCLFDELCIIFQTITSIQLVVLEIPNDCDKVTSITINPERLQTVCSVRYQTLENQIHHALRDVVFPQSGTCLGKPRRLGAPRIDRIEAQVVYCTHYRI